jgi:xanthine dehydrogenase/oxidase
MTNLLLKDEELFATSKILHNGQLIALIIAKSEEIARMAAKKVDIRYEKLPSILTIEEAIEKGSFFPMTREIKTGSYLKGMVI